MPTFLGKIMHFCLSRGMIYLYKMYVQTCVCVYVGLKVFHDACIILYTFNSSLYFALVFFLGRL